MNQTVLIVNENANARIIAETLLRSRGIDTLGAQDAMEALDILERNGSDVGLLVVDLDEMSPGMSGWELMRQIRRRFGGLPLPHQPRVVVQSERSHPEAERFVRHLGAEAFFRKPMAPARFLEQVADLLTQKNAQSGPLRLGQAH
jgi:chemotaxis family two-component system sensor histidine kinase/response regulator PixL